MLRGVLASRRTLVVLVLSFLTLMTLAPMAHAANVAPVEIKRLDDISAGDTAWMLTSAALVLMMTGPGLALFYSGLVRRKNVLATMMQSFILMAAVTIVWVIVGYSLAFDVGNSFIGGLRFAFLRGVGGQPCEYAPTIPHTTWAAYQCMFAIITPALICGAYAERMKFSSMLLFSILWLLGIYCPLAHMVWGKGGFFNASNPNAAIPVLDFAGGVVVHLSSGISALICALVLGKRRGYGKLPMPPHSVVLAVVGAALLWVGWFGFNAGSAGSAGYLASNAFIVTHIAGAMATLAWLAVEWFKTGKPTVLGGISGAVAGLAMVTPASGYTSPMFALAIGAFAGVSCFFGATMLKQLLGYDDSLDAFGVHGVSGIFGTLLTGVFAVAWLGNNKGGWVDGRPVQFVYQLLAVLIVSAGCAIGSLAFLKISDLLCGLRVSESDEYDGLDLSQHGESGYNLEEEAFGASALDAAGSTSLAREAGVVATEGAGSRL